MRLVLSFPCLLLFCVAAGGWTAEAADRVTVTTGTPGGLYYAAGNAICRTLMARATRPGVSCTTRPSSGSMSNVLDLDPTSVQFGIVQSDIQYNAVTGGGLFETIGANQNLRSVFSLHEEAFTVLVKADAHFATFDDLRGKRLSAGSMGTGTRETAEALFVTLGWSEADRKNITQISVDKQAAALCAGEVDAISYLIGHPSNLVANAAQACPVKAVTVSKETTDLLSKALPFYETVEILGGLYPGVAEPVTTAGLRAAVVTTAAVPDRLVFEVVASVFQNLSALQQAAPAFGGLVPQQMSTQGLIAPLHPGALRFYQAHGSPTPSVTIAPTERSPFQGSETVIQPPNKLTIDPKIGVGAAPPGSGKTAAKPAYNSVPVGPGQNWRLESGEFNTTDPALGADESLPDVGNNIRLRIPSPK